VRRLNKVSAIAQHFRRLLKTRLQAAQKDLRGEAREHSASAGVIAGTSEETMERNEAYESFSAAC
jgi:hypothetical protein